jgi:peptidoglycan/LPS O-acetylase OafA/YrhL
VSVARPIAHRHMPALDGVRGLAILMVMFHHFTILAPVSGVERALASVAAMGRYGVDLFFVLSGCLITGILIDGRGLPHYFRTFYARRVLRIFPLYYAMVAVTFLVVPHTIRLLPAEKARTVNAFLAPGDWPWFVAFVSNFLIAIRDRYTNGLLDASWSLAIEEHFYLLWPAVVFALPSLRRLRHVCAAVIAVSLLLRIGAWMAGWSRLQIYVVTFTRLDALAFGALVAILMRSSAAAWTDRLRQAGSLSLVLLAAIVALWQTGQMEYTATVMNTIGYTLVGALGMQLVIQAVPLERRGIVHRLFDNGPMRFFGKYSYGLYMFQLPVKGALTLLFFNQARMLSSPLVWQAAFYALAGMATTASALVSWHLLEKNMLALKDRLAFTPDGQPI